MVALADVTRAAGLASESRQLAQAIAAFGTEGFAIVRMVVAPDLIPVDTSDMTYPPAMKDAILVLLQTRKDAVDQELEGLGVVIPEPEPEPGPETPPPERPEPPPPEPEPEPPPDAARRVRS